MRPHIGVLSGLYGLIIFIPSLSILIRRLHDISRSGWWIFIGVIPFIGQLILFIFTLLKGGVDNIYGSPPTQTIQLNHERKKVVKVCFKI